MVFAFPLIVVCGKAYSTSGVNDEIPVAEGRITYADQPLWEITTQPPRFWMRSERGGSVKEGEVRYEEGYFKIYNLSPGYYSVGVRLDLNPDNPEYFPGDFAAFESFPVEINETARLDLELRKIIHLTKPVDNDALILDFDKSCQNKKEISRNVRFEWEPIAEAEKYYYKLTTGTCSPFTHGDVLEKGYTHNTYVDLELVPSTRNSYYGFSVLGRRGGDSVGTFVIHGRSGHGWEYRFKAK